MYLSSTDMHGGGRGDLLSLTSAKPVAISVSAGTLGIAANLPVAPYIPFGVVGFVSGVIMLLAAVALARTPTRHVAWALAIIWFAVTCLVSGLFWLAVGLSLSASGALYIGLGGVSASVLGLWGGVAALVWKPS